MKKYFIKHLFLLALLTVTAITSCKDDDATYDMPYVEVSQSSVAAAYNESSVSFDITTNRQWKVTVYTNSESEAWYAINPETGEGNQTISVDLSPNQGGLRTLVLKISTGTLSEYVTIKQAGESGVTEFVTLFEENMGTTEVSANTTIDVWAAGTYPAGFQRGGEGGADATYADEGGFAPTVRKSGANSAGSGGNNIWLPYGDGNYFVVDNIKTNGESAAKLSFYRLSNLTTGETDGWISDDVNDSYLQVYIIRDGVLGEKLSYTGSTSSAWGLVTTEAFDISTATTIGFRFGTTHASIGSRIDDLLVETTDEVPTPAEPVPSVSGTASTGLSDNSVTITGSYTYTGTETITEVGVAYKAVTGSAYTTVPMSSVPADGNVSVTITGLSAGTAYTYYIYVTNAVGTYKGEELTFTTTGTAASHIFEEDMGATEVSSNTAIATWADGVYPAGFQRGGTGGANATYTGNSEALPTVRKSGANTNGSGGNNIWLPAVSTAGLASYFDIDNIAISGVSTVKMTFNRFSNKYNATDPDWNGDADNDNFLKVYIIRNGVVGEQVSYAGGTDYNWAFVTTAAVDVTGATTIGFRFEGVSTLGIRIDDITIDETTDTPPSTTAPTVTTGSASNIAETTVTLAGTFVKGSETITEAGIAYKASSESSYTTVPMSSVPTDSNISVNITGLTAGTAYSYYAYVTTASATFKGSDVGFTTLGGTSGGPTAGTVLFDEDMGSTEVSSNTAVASFTEYKRGGVGAENVTFVGSANGVSVRKTGASDNEGSSGGNNIWIPSGGSAYLVIDGIQTKDADSATLKFNRRANSGTWDDDSSNDSFLQVYLIKDDIESTAPLQYVGSTSSLWNFVTVSSLDLSDASTFGFKFVCTNTSQGVRIDDLTVTVE